MTADVVGRAPAPAPWKSTRPMRSPSTCTALSTPSTFASSSSAGMKTGWTRASTPSVVAAGDGEELDRVAELSRVAEVARGEPRDAFAVDLVRVDGRVKGEAGEDRELVSGVVALDVVRGLRFRVAEVLRAHERVGEVDAVVAHPREDVVGRAVDDGADTGDLVGGEVALEGGDDGDAAADAGFVEDVDAGLVGRARSFAPCFAMTSLLAVTTDWPALKAPLDVLEGRFFAAHHLDDDVAVSGQGLLRVVGENAVGEGEGALAGGIAHEDAAQGRGEGPPGG